MGKFNYDKKGFTNHVRLDPRNIYPYKKLTSDIIYSTKPISKMSLEGTYRSPDIKYNNNYDYYDKKEINSLGYRCDEFITKHDGKHILFTGCSHTFGDGLIENEVWSKRLYDKINKNEKCSGFFNLGIPASSIINQIMDLFKYFKTFGNPDVIFFNLTEKQRMYVYDKDVKELFDGSYYPSSQNILDILVYQYYFMLNQYCKSNNIKLLSFSWLNLLNDQKDQVDFFKKYFENFYFHSIDEAYFYITDYQKNNKNDEYNTIGRDNVHLGNAYHYFWSEYMYKRYKEIK